MKQLHFSVFLFRRLVYILILILGKDYPWLQISLCVVKTFLMAAFLVIVQPFDTPLANLMNIMNECFTGFAFATCYNFTEGMDPGDS